VGYHANMVSMLCAIDGSARSTDRAALSVDRSLAQQSVDRAAIGRSRNNRPIAHKLADR